jgi:hypothetical protein
MEPQLSGIDLEKLMADIDRAEGGICSKSPGFVLAYNQDTGEVVFRNKKISDLKTLLVVFSSLEIPFEKDALALVMAAILASKKHVKVSGWSKKKYL